MFFLSIFASISQFVNDHAGVLSREVTQRLEEKLKQVEETESTQIVVLTVTRLENETIEDFACRTFNQYKIGQKDKDNGILICISKDDRAVRIEVGKGLEGKLVDLTTGRIIRERMIPYLKNNNYDQGIEEGVDAVIQVVKGEFQAVDTSEGNKKSTICFVIIFMLLWILFFFRRRSGGGYGGTPYIWAGHGSSFSSGGFSGFSGGGGGSSGGGASGKF